MLVGPCWLCGAPRCAWLVLPALFRLGHGEAWQQGLNATHFWDCNGAGCDSTVLQPWNEFAYRYAPQYAPMDPEDYGGSVHGEKLWLTGAASDALSAWLGPNACCGADDANSGGCGQCLLVKNPTATNAHWTAVVMKKSRCPPESHGCELPFMHIDIAVPGYDNFTYSTANVCGLPSRQDTFVTKEQSGACAAWYTHGASTIQGCSCNSLPSDSTGQGLLKRGCELFTEWGWTSGDPDLWYMKVDCPPRFRDVIEGAFGATGVEPPGKKTAYLWLFIILGICVAMCIVGCGIQFWSVKQEEKDREKKRQERLKKQARRRGELEDLTESNSSSSNESE